MKRKNKLLFIFVFLLISCKENINIKTVFLVYDENSFYVDALFGKESVLKSEMKNLKNFNFKIIESKDLDIKKISKSKDYYIFDLTLENLACQINSNNILVLSENKKCNNILYINLDYDDMIKNLSSAMSKDYYKKLKGVFIYDDLKFKNSFKKEVIATINMKYMTTKEFNNFEGITNLIKEKDYFLVILKKPYEYIYSTLENAKALITIDRAMIKFSEVHNGKNNLYYIKYSFIDIANALINHSKVKMHILKKINSIN